MALLGETACALSFGALVAALVFAWLERPAVPGRFLLYDTKLGEGFNLQREVFPRAAWLAAELNRKLEARCGRDASAPECLRWAVVLPPWCRVAHWETGPTPLPWSEFFDEAALRSARVPVMEFHEYARAVGGGTVDLAVALAEDTPEGQRFFSGSAGKFLRWAPDLAPCSEDRGGNGVPRHRRDAASGRLNLTYAGECEGGVSARELRCAVLDSPFPGGVVDMLRQIEGGVRSVLLKNYDSHLAPDDEEMDAYGLREAMLFSPEVRRRGDQFVARAFGGRPFLSAHCRRTDFLRARRRTTPAAGAVAEQLNEALAANGLDQVFVATDAPEDIKEKLQAEVRGAVHFFEHVGAWLHPGKQAAVEMWIAARADVFLGTAESRFTMWIQLERGFLGWPSRSSEQEFCKTAGKKRCVAPKGRQPRRPAANREAFKIGK